MQHVKDDNMKEFYFRRDRENKDTHDEILANDSINVVPVAASASASAADDADDDDSNRHKYENRAQQVHVFH